MNAKDRRAFEQQALPLMENLYGAGMRLTRNPAEAEDLVQDTIVRAWRFWDTYNQDTNIKAWMFTILRNTFINSYHRGDRRREGKRKVNRQARALGDSATIGGTGLYLVPQDEAMDAASSAVRAAEAMAELPENYREAIEMHVAGLSYADIAECLECPIGTVMSRIYRGRKELYQLLRGHAEVLGLIDEDAPDIRPSTRRTS